MAKKQLTYSESLTYISAICLKCKGCCWHDNDQRATHEEVLEKFGIIPNACVNSSDGDVECPFAKIKT